jgi:hypothetical protein
MGNHIDTRGSRRQKVREGDDLARRRRATFKQYLQQIEEELLEEDLDAIDDSADTSDEDQDE